MTHTSEGHGHDTHGHLTTSPGHGGEHDGILDLYMCCSGDFD